jgi:hypothetical protein
VIKKVLIYVALSAILIALISAIITVTIINQPKNDYVYFEANYDYSNLETREVEIRDINETLSLQGKFSGYKINEQSVAKSITESVIYLSNIGDNITKGDTICVVGNRRIVSKYSGKLANPAEIDKAVIFVFESASVDKIVIDVPSKYLSYFDKSSATLAIGDEKITVPLLNKNSIANSVGDTFQAYYSINAKNLLMGAVVPVNVTTGRKMASAICVPRICVYKNSSGSYYIETVDGDIKNQIPVTIGIGDTDYIEIKPSDDSGKELISQGLKITINQIDIFKDANENRTLEDDNTEDSDIQV